MIVFDGFQPHLTALPARCDGVERGFVGRLGLGVGFVAAFALCYRSVVLVDAVVEAGNKGGVLGIAINGDEGVDAVDDGFVALVGGYAGCFHVEGGAGIVFGVATFGYVLEVGLLGFHFGHPVG